MTVVVGSESYVSEGLPVTKYDMIVRGRLTLLGRWSVSAVSWWEVGAGVSEGMRAAKYVLIDRTPCIARFDTFFAL